MRTRLSPHRGSCLLSTLFALTIIAVLLIIAGIVLFVTSDAQNAVANLGTMVTSLTDRATTFEAPASIELTLEKGGGAVAYAKDGKVGDKIIGAPTTDVRYTVSITDKDGNAVAFQANNGPRNPSAPIDLIGTFEVVESGSYKFDIKASDGSATPAAIMIGSVTQEEAAALADSGIALLKGLGGGCVFGCGALMLVGFGIPALIVRSRSKKAPPDVLDVA